MICPTCEHEPSMRYPTREFLNRRRCPCKCHDVADAGPELLAACHTVASWLSARATHYVSLGSEDVARGLLEQAHVLETAAAKAEGVEP